MPNEQSRSMTDLIAALQVGQSASLMALISLLIDKDIIAPGEIIERLRHASQQATISDGGFAAATAVDGIIQFLESRFPADAASKSGESS